MPDSTSQTQWKKGPLPADTWNWGALVTQEFAGTLGFFFADFKGDHAMIATEGPPKRVEAADIAFFNNAIDMPPAK